VHCTRCSVNRVVTESSDHSLHPATDPFVICIRAVLPALPRSNGGRRGRPLAERSAQVASLFRALRPVQRAQAHPPQKLCNCQARRYLLIVVTQAGPGSGVQESDGAKAAAPRDAASARGARVAEAVW
jgi:hypothetical protein